MPEEFSKTAMYDDYGPVPPLVEAAVNLSREKGFISSCFPQQGELLRVLACGRNGGRIGETGTGCGVGLAWMVSATDATTCFISVERDADRARASQDLFASYPNVEILHGDWRLILDRGPFDLLVLDGGGGAKRPGDAPADLSGLLVPGGTIVLDDFHPPFAGWPPAAEGGTDETGRDLDNCRAHWFDHPDLLATEVRVHPEASALLATWKG